MRVQAALLVRRQTIALCTLCGLVHIHHFKTALRIFFIGIVDQIAQFGGARRPRSSDDDIISGIALLLGNARIRPLPMHSVQRLGIADLRLANIARRIVAHQHPRPDNGLGRGRVPQPESLALRIVQYPAQVHRMRVPRRFAAQHRTARMLLRPIEHSFGGDQLLDTPIVDEEIFARK